VSNSLDSRLTIEHDGSLFSSFIVRVFCWSSHFFALPATVSDVVYDVTICQSRQGKSYEIGEAGAIAITSLVDQPTNL
jgi:hypothetical protein